MKTITIIGLGLIGGSLALRLRERGVRLLGVDNNAEHRDQALQRGLIDAVLPLDAAVDAAGLVVLAVPVDAALDLLPAVLDRVDDRQIVFDVGSTKAKLVATVRAHPRRGRYVATHPMWGTEYSGPLAAVADAFTGKPVVICDAQQSDADAAEAVRALYRLLGMRIVEMDARRHDVHAACVSHVSHVTSFALANTLLAREREDPAIFELAGTGLGSTVRLAKSDPAMWVPIFRQNRANVLDVLDAHIRQIEAFRDFLKNENYIDLHDFIKNANRIKRIIQ